MFRPCEVHVFVGRVVRGRRACDRPVRSGVHVAHAELEARERLNRIGAVAEGRGAEQLPDDALLTFFPRQPSGDINWMDNRRPGFLGGEHGAVEAARQHHECIMYSVTKRIEFCYGHRLLDYDGICKHPHGHNAVAEIEVRSGSLDNRNMVCDFSDIKRVVKGWVDRELDHKMILREDDPLVGPLKASG